MRLSEADVLVVTRHRLGDVAGKIDQHLTGDAAWVADVGIEQISQSLRDIDGFLSAWIAERTGRTGPQTGEAQ